MKKSNIIIIALSLFLVGGVLVLYIDSINTKVEDQYFRTWHKEFSLPPFNVIVAEKGSDLHIEQSDFNNIQIEYFQDKKNPSKLYGVSGDTLYVYSGLRLFVKCKHLKTLIGNKHKWVGINDFLTDSLAIRLSGGEMNFHNENINEKYWKKKTEPKMIGISIISKDSAQVNIYNVCINHLDIKSDSAFINIQSNINSINADLMHCSTLNISPVYKWIKIKKDNSCSFSSGQ